MNLYRISIAFFLFCMPGWGAEQRFARTEITSWERGLSSFSLEGVDLRPLQAKARERIAAPCELDLATLVEKNVHYIVRNRLNQGRFLRVPSPEAVIHQIEAVLDRNEELNQLLREGRGLLAQRESRKRCVELTFRIEKVAADLKNRFEDYFLEGRSTSYVFEFPRYQRFQAEFTQFLLHSHQINLRLTRRLDEYFFDSHPGLIDLSDYEGDSILALSESLRKLSRLVRGDLQLSR